MSRIHKALLFADLHESSSPVTFNLTFKENYAEFVKSPVTQFTLNPREVRLVTIEVKDKEYFQNNNASQAKDLLVEVIAFQPGLHHKKAFQELLNISADEEYIPFPKKSKVAVDLENYYDGYGHGSDLKYRVLVMKNHTHLLHKPLLITSQWHGSSGKVLWDHQTRIEKGLLIDSTKLLNNTRTF